MFLCHSQRSFLFILYFVLLSFSPSVNAAPSGINRYEGVARRQDSNQPPVTFTTVTEKNTASGVVKETCVITLTPITVNGTPEVQEVKQCTISPLDSSDPGAEPSGGAETTTTSFSSSQQTSLTTSTPSATSFSVNASGSTSATPAVSVNGVSTVPASSASSSSSSVSSTASTSGSASAKPAVSVNGVSTVPASPIPTPTSSGTPSPTPTLTLNSATTVSPSGSAAAVNATESGFAIPGKKLSVLPIGLGVFAGISVIALIVVGLVTYERTKYRKAFRQRKLAETGAAMAYGGMAQRV